MIYLFLLVRGLDVASTIYGLNHGQFEWNPTNNWLISHGIIWFVLVQILFAYIVIKLYKYRLVRITVNIFTFLNLGVVLLNLIIIFYALKGGV